MSRANLLRAACAAATLLLPATQLLGQPPAAKRSSLYAPQRGHLRFDHAAHTQAPCAACHTSASTSQRAADSLSPNMQACATCHTGQPDQAPGMQRCADCHIGSRASAQAPPTTPAQWRAVQPAPLITPPPRTTAIRFSHAAHKDAPCAACHGDAQKPSLPNMATCTTCHSGQPGQPTADCAACHTTAAAATNSPSRQAIAAANATTKNTKKLAPADHSVDWLKRHGPLSRAQGDTCNSCHTPPSCAECHGSQQAGPYKVHPPHYITQHAAAARSDMANCTDCHKVETSCAGCHARTRNLPDAPLAPPPRVAYHPPGWLDANSPGNHGVQARRHIADCASCHQERDCISCHQGISPHPDTFATECARLLQANPTPCLKCHTSANSLRMMCR
jgi:hypothetical protein